MPKPFVPLTLAQFAELVRTFVFTRTISAVHMHHTWRPNHSQYNGVATIEGMWRDHTQNRAFADIAQHVTIAPDGTIWTGRNWNQSPASATGNNGNSSFGPFMFEMIGDFDHGKDPFQDPQRAVAIQVIALIQQRFSLLPETVKFHNQMSPKSCPGSAVDYMQTVRAVQAAHVTVDEQRRSDSAHSEESPFSGAWRDKGLTDEDLNVVRLAQEALRSAGSRDISTETELPETGGAPESRDQSAGAGDLLRLRPYVIDIDRGRLVQSGEYSSLPEDVERIFGEEMEEAFHNPAAYGMPERKLGEPFRIMLWAHGGLVSEKAGLAGALSHIDFWTKNGIFPVMFVWETGLLASVGHLLQGMMPGSRNFFSDHVSDPLIEGAARAAGGVKIWGDMKNVAERASLPDGGAFKSAQELKTFCDRHQGDRIEIYAAGHSAGAIFHSYFLPVVFAQGVPALKALYFLAPAIRTDLFRDRLLPLIGTRIGRLDMFAMNRPTELNDDCAAIYRKSLLYLIRFALEPEKDAELVGLEESVRRDAATKTLFGLGGAPSSGHAEAVFSPTPASDGPSASRSTSHGGFDDDPHTMNSIALRMLGKQVASQLAMQFPKLTGRAAGEDPWTAPEVTAARTFRTEFRPAPASAPAPSPQPTAPAVFVPGKAGRRIALCIGIDDYTGRPLSGCVADARLWGKTLGNLGFQTSILAQHDAEYDNLKAEIQKLIRSGQAGDSLVLQYSGHGTQVPDLNGDEATGNDQAVCPIDSIQSGRYLIDDDIGAMIDELKAGVRFTMMMDCCHSGTINRFGVGEPPAVSGKARFLPLTEDMRQKYIDFALARGSRSFTKSRSRGASQATVEVLFSACRSGESAMERNGQGDFTLRATSLLAQSGGAFTNRQFIDAVVKAFGSAPEQMPNITCSSELLDQALFGGTAAGGRSLGAPSAAGGSRFGDLADAVGLVADALRRV